MPDEKRRLPGYLQVDESGFVQVDGVRVCRVDAASGTLLFFDRDRRRSARRGSREVPVRVEDFLFQVQSFRFQVQENACKD